MSRQSFTFRIKSGLILLGILFSTTVSAQLSPGDLSKPHAHLEGINNCTQCHQLGSTVSDVKCLNCHTPLKNQIRNGRGYHASAQIKGKSCVSCHSEHHGRNFKMIRFDTKAFNHNLTGYKLEGQHARTDCRQCHKAENIQDPNIRKNRDTYLGLQKYCLNCHDDHHRKTLGNDCASCHTFESFSTAPRFNHAKTKFPLTGAHQKTDCASCHKIDVVNGKKYHNWGNLKANSCNECHRDVHQGAFGNKCQTCHNTTSFNDIKASGFNHNLTGFALSGKHKTLNCNACHDGRNGARESHKEFAAIKNISCINCHKDVHEGKFGIDCKSCHNENSFGASKLLKESFEHSRTGFELKGKHANVDCRACHSSGSMTRALPHSQCISCHKDHHKGEFKGQDCAGCHDESGFEKTSFTLSRHQATAFPLENAHAATLCSDCHLKENEWRFRKIGTQCVDCHKNIHTGFMSEKYLAQGCKSCHNTSSWGNVTFDHSTTQFNLTGKHEKVDCRACHLTEDGNKQAVQRFEGLAQNCTQCHENIHGEQFSVNSETDCRRCHAFDNWQAVLFDHNTARFQLSGAHATVNCSACHHPEIMENRNVVIYRNNKLDCVDCHK